jgi:carotenoid cleavage dioxygenase-like enzyme
MTVIFGPNNYSAHPQYDTGTTHLKLSYLYSFSRTFMPSLFLSVKGSDARYSQINFSDPLLKSCR